MRKHQRLNTYHQELANRSASRKAQAKPSAVALANVFWAEYYRLSSTKCVAKEPQFSIGTWAEITFRMALTERMVTDMISYMLLDGITHRDPQGEYITSILSDGIKVTA